MIKVGLTGGIGSGKSIVTNIFKVLGIPVFDADAAAKKIMDTDESLQQALIKEFGSNTYTGGRLNRSYLASQVFNDTFKLEKLNALVHPVTIAAANEWMENQTAPYVVKEAALIFESGSGANLDFIIGVFAPKHTRLQRVMDRDKLAPEEVQARMNRQIDDSIKMKLCNFVLMNDEKSLLIPQVLALHNQLTSVRNNKLL
jgi:dephospho-CoA kinase